MTDGCETNLNTSVTNCGVCGNACNSTNDTPSCSGGLCNSTCNTGYANCNNTLAGNGCNINLNTDPNHCGGCTTVCNGTNDTPSCSGGLCNSTCNAGYANCSNTLATNGCNVNLSNDPANCGSCGHACGPTAPTRVNGTCTAPLMATCPSLILSIGASVSAQVGASGGTGPYLFSVTLGSLPPGTILDATSGVITGTVAGPRGTGTVVFGVVDAKGITASTGVCTWSES